MVSQLREVAVAAVVVWGVKLPLRVSFQVIEVIVCINAIYKNTCLLSIVIGHVQTIGVKRPGFGTSGRPIQVTVNAFDATVTNGIIYHYDGQLTVLSS